MRQYYREATMEDFKKDTKYYYEAIPNSVLSSIDKVRAINYDLIAATAQHQGSKTAEARETLVAYIKHLNAYDDFKLLKTVFVGY
jgi:hypothetical protein